MCAGEGGCGDAVGGGWWRIVDGPGLKNEVLEMYVGLSAKSFRNVFLADGEDEEWDSGFMGDLVVRMFARCENLKGKGKGGEEGRCRGAGEGGGGWWSWEWEGDWV